MAQNAASSPFQLPVAPVAGFTGLQNQAFQQTQAQQGMAQPYFNQAQGLFNQSAAPISGSQVNNYLNPYAGYVMQNLANQQGQQMNDLTGRATQTAGGVGADRIGVAQGELANQQSLATGQTLSGIYGSALSAAQQDAQRQQSAAYGIGNLGGAAQNAAMAGTQQLYGMGSQQQQLNQAQLNAPYQNQLAQIAFPYQNAQYLAGVTGSLAGALGGTTNSNQQTTPAQPSIYSQIAGLGAGAAGAYGMFGGSNPFSSPSYGGGNAFSGDAYGGSGSSPLPGLTGADYGYGYASGGEVGGGEPAWMQADPTIPQIALHPTQVNQPKVQFSQPGSGSNTGSDIGSIFKTAATLAPMFLARGGRTGYADGGETDDYLPQDFENRFNRASTMGQIERPRFAESATLGEMPRTIALAHYMRSDPEGHNSPSFARGSDPASTTSPAGTGLPGDTPYRMPSVKADGSPLVAEADVPDATIPTGPVEFGGSKAAAETAAKNKSDMQGTTYDAPYKDLNLDNTSRQISRSPWLALMNAGFGMMAGTSPYAGVNIGKGLQEGVKTLEGQRTSDREDETVNQRAKQLAMQADQHLRQYTQLTPAAVATIENQKAVLKQNQAKLEESGWVAGGENMLTGEKTFFNPRTGESGLLKRTGEWQPFKAGAIAPSAEPPPAPVPPPAVAGPSATVAPTPPGAIPPPPAPAAPPAPFGVPALASNLEAPTSPMGYIGKGSPLSVGAATDLRTQITANNKAAQQMPALEQDISAMKLAYATLIKDADKDGFLSRLALQPGAQFGERLEHAKQANAVAVAAGQTPPFDPGKVAAAENINKIQKRMGLTFSSQISPREAMAGQMIGVESTPGLTNSPAGFRRVLSGFESLVADTKDQQAFFQNYLAKNGHSLGWRQAYDKQNPAERYIVKSLIDTLPDNLQKGLPEAIAQLKSDPKKYKDTFNKYYSDTADFFLRNQ